MRLKSQNKAALQSDKRIHPRTLTRCSGLVKPARSLGYTLKEEENPIQLAVGVGGSGFRFISGDLSEKEPNKSVFGGKQKQNLAGN